MSTDKSSPGQSTPSARQDRLLQSEVKELQGKVASLEKENYELKQQLAKYIGVDTNVVRRARQVGFLHRSFVDMYYALYRYTCRSTVQYAIGHD